MAKHGFLMLLLGVALGANFVMGAWLVANSLSPHVASGATVDTQGGYTLATGRIQGGGEADVLYVWNHETMKLGIYMMRNRSLEVLAIRNCSSDFDVDGFILRGEQNPVPGGVKKRKG